MSKEQGAASGISWSHGWNVNQGNSVVKICGNWEDIWQRYKEDGKQEKKAFPMEK